jgi:hypothetical protein
MSGGGASVPPPAYVSAAIASRANGRHDVMAQRVD